jgi:hypothetical protein
MASALIAVQVALCAVIGFVTFGAGHHGTNGQPRPESLAANAPHLIPTAMPNGSGLSPAGPLISRSPSKSTPKSPPTRASTSADGQVLMAPSPPSKSSKPGLLPPGDAPEPPAATMAPSPGPTTPAETRLPTPSPTGSVQSGAVEDQRCNPVNALGRTADGSVLVCLPAIDGSLHWKTT